MEETIKQDKSKSQKEFEKLLSQDLNNRKFKEGEITTGISKEPGTSIILIFALPLSFSFAPNIKFLDKSL